MSAEIVHTTVAVCSIFVWLALFIQACNHAIMGVRLAPYRSPWFTLAGLLAAIGMAASNLGYLQTQGLIPTIVSIDWIHYVAGIGRGGMLFGGLLLLLSHDPQQVRR